MELDSLVSDTNVAESNYGSVLIISKCENLNQNKQLCKWN